MKELVNSMNRWKISKKLQIVTVKEMHIKKQLIQLRKLSLELLFNLKKNGVIIWFLLNRPKVQSIITLRLDSSKKQLRLRLLLDNGIKRSSYYNIKLQRQQDLSIVKQPNTMQMSDNMILLKNTLLNQDFQQMLLKCMLKLLNGRKHFRLLEKIFQKAKL